MPPGCSHAPTFTRPTRRERPPDGRVLVQSETFRRSFVTWRIVIAQVCLNTCGDTRFDARDGQRFSATRTYFSRCIRTRHESGIRREHW